MSGKLPRPVMESVAYFRGEFVPLSQANVNLASQGLQHGTGVFEGIRAYWNPQQDQLYGLFVKEHFQRMESNCRFLRLKLPSSPAELTAITRELLQRNQCRQNTYIRPVIFKDDPYLGLDLTGLTESFGIYTLPMGAPLSTSKGLHLTVSSWQRPDDNAIPGRGKLTGCYINACLAVDDARLAGFDDALMLTADGHVAEGAASNLFMVRGGTLITSPVSDAILEGITRAAVMTMARDLGIPLETRRIDRTELYVAEELFLCGTGVQITPITKLDHRPIGDGVPGPILCKLQELYFSAVTGEQPRYAHWVTPIYENPLTFRVASTPGS